MAAVLEIENLKKAYPGGMVALDGVTLAIEAGEIFALLGPNGAGKTTLIGLVCGLIRKSSGSMKLFGIDLAVDSLGPRSSVGLVPQEVNFDPFFTARESLEIQLGYYGRPPDPKRINEMLQALALQDRADVPTRALSGGMKRRLLIAKALVHRPRLVFLDEPTAGVDVELRRDLWAYVRKLRDGGTTVVLTTHYLEEAEALADRIGIIDHGKLLVLEGKESLMQRLGERRLEVRFATPLRELPVALRWGSLEDDGKRFVFLERHGEGPRAAALLAHIYGHGLAVVDVSTERAHLEDVMIQILRSGGGQL